MGTWLSDGVFLIQYASHTIVAWLEETLNSQSSWEFTDYRGGEAAPASVVAVHRRMDGFLSLSHARPSDDILSKHELVYVAPSPVFAGLERLHNRVTRVIKVLRSVLVLRGVAAAYVTASHAQTQVNPGLPVLQAFLTALRAGHNGSSSTHVCTIPVAALPFAQLNPHISGRGEAVCPSGVRRPSYRLLSSLNHLFRNFIRLENVCQEPDQAFPVFGDHVAGARLTQFFDFARKAGSRQNKQLRVDGMRRPHHPLGRL
jgi:hypothetical protein